MPVTVDRKEAGWVIRVEGEFTLGSAAELRSLLAEAVVSGRELQLDLTRVCDLDVTLLQLVWAAGRQAASQDTEIVCRRPEACASAWREAGFPQFPGVRDAGACRG